MQTFLPYGADFAASARVLDRARLGKQRIECYQILKALTDEHYGWKDHPAVRMWRGHEGALVRYAMAICDEWASRGYKDTVRQQILDYVIEIQNNRGGPLLDSLPQWLTIPETEAQVIRTHRATLLAKAPDYYSKFGWTEEPKIEYYWPVEDFNVAL